MSKRVVFLLPALLLSSCGNSITDIDEYHMPDLDIGQTADPDTVLPNSALNLRQNMSTKEIINALNEAELYSYPYKISTLLHLHKDKTLQPDIVEKGFYIGSYFTADNTSYYFNILKSQYEEDGKTYNLVQCDFAKVYSEIISNSEFKLEKKSFNATIVENKDDGYTGIQAHEDERNDFSLELKNIEYRNFNENGYDEFRNQVGVADKFYNFVCNSVGFIVVPGIANLASRFSNNGIDVFDYVSVSHYTTNKYLIITCEDTTQCNMYPFDARYLGYSFDNVKYISSSIKSTTFLNLSTGFIEKRHIEFYNANLNEFKSDYPYIMLDQYFETYSDDNFDRQANKYIDFVKKNTESIDRTTN